MGSAKWDKQLDRIYYNTSDPGSYGGIRRLLRRAHEKGLSQVDELTVKRYLSKQQAYSLHKPARRRFPRNKTIVGQIDKQWQADLADMQGISKENDGYRYLLTVIDIFSKFAWVIPVKDKTGKNIVTAFEELLDHSAPRIPTRIQTDAGKEFLNKQLATFLKHKGIHHFVSASDQKAAVIERFNRTLKTRIWTYFTAKQTHRYIDILQNIVSAYNNSYHRTIGMKPTNVRKKHERALFLRMYPEIRKFNISQPSSVVSSSADRRILSPGQMVRISKLKGNFEKGYMPNWSEEHFLVSKSPETAQSRQVYKLKDKGDDMIKGIWYPEELQEIENNRYLIEEILKKRKDRRGRTEYFVKWKGWPQKFNTWVPASDLEYVS